MSGRRLALLIANDEFDDPSFQQLKAPELDASTLESLLKNPDLCNFFVKTLYNKTSNEVNRAIEEFYTDSTRTDTLLLYFSGHGIKDEEGKLYFVTKDTERKYLNSTAIRSSDINEEMEGSRSRQQILIIDCCYSGAFAKGSITKSENIIGSSVGSIERFKARGRVILTASDAMQYAYEEEGLFEGTGTHSIFTSAIITGLKTYGADENNDGIITVDELYDYVDAYVTERTPKQRPNIWALGVQGDIIFAQKRPGGTQPSTRKEVIEPSEPKPGLGPPSHKDEVQPSEPMRGRDEVQGLLTFLKSFWGILTGISLFFPVIATVINIQPIWTAVIPEYQILILSMLINMFNILFTFSLRFKYQNASRETLLRRARLDLSIGLIGIIIYMFILHAMPPAWHNMWETSDIVRYANDVFILISYSAFFLSVSKAFMLLGFIEYFQLKHST